MLFVVVNKVFISPNDGMVNFTAMSNQELINTGMKRMDETDQAIERSKQVSFNSLIALLLLYLCS